ncbi:MAG: DMT family transporter [Kofleriaceae bacterium]
MSDATAEAAPTAEAAAAIAATSRRGVAMVTAAAASWGLWSLFLRPTGLPAAVTSPLVFALMGLLALPLARRGAAPRWSRRARRLLVANAACDALNVLTFFAAMDQTSVAIAVLTHYVAPILVALAAPWIDRERNPAAVGAAALALAGLALVLEPWRHGVEWWGATLGLVSACAYAGNVFIVRRLAAEIGAARAICYHSLLAAVLLAPLAWLTPAPALTAGALALLIAASATIGAGSGILYVGGLARIGSARSGVLTFAEPLVAVAVGIVVWREPATLTMLLGGGLVLLAGLWVVRGGSATELPSPAPPPHRS